MIEEILDNDDFRAETYDTKRTVTDNLFDEGYADEAFFSLRNLKQ